MAITRSKLQMEHDNGQHRTGSSEMSIWPLSQVHNVGGRIEIKRDGKQEQCRGFLLLIINATIIKAFKKHARHLAVLSRVVDINMQFILTSDDCLLLPRNSIRLITLLCNIISCFYCIPSPMSGRYW